jgi:hypothetical protein
MCGFGSTPKPPPLPKPIPLPQASKAPDQETFKRKNVNQSRAGMGAGNKSTLLSGVSGDAVPDGQLGKSTLLGS